MRQVVKSGFIKVIALEELSLVRILVGITVVGVIYLDLMPVLLQD